MTSRLKVGVVGVGVGRIHLDTYQKLSDRVEITAICDANGARLTEVGDAYNVPHRYTDFDHMLSDGHVEAISICLPNSLHAPISIAALEAGLHVLCEKPLAENAAAGQRIVEAAAKARGKFMMCFNRRYRADVRWIKRMLDEGALGKVYQVKAGWVRETGIPTGWFTDKLTAGGGPLIDLGVHMLDAIMWLLDYPDPLTISGTVQANFGPRRLKTWSVRSGGGGGYGVEDSATAFVRLAGNTTLFLETSWASHARPGLDDIFITLQGTEGTIELYIENYASEHTLTLYTEANGVPLVTRPAIKGIRHDHEYAVTEFVRCIQEDTEPTATVEEGQTIMKMIDAIYESAELGREVVLGKENGD